MILPQYSYYIIASWNISFKMKVICFWIIVLLHFQIHAVTVEEITKLVANILENGHVPAMEAFTCWTKLENVRLLKVSKVPIRLHNQFKMVSHRSNNNIHDLWYFIDMRCDGASEFLSTLDKEYFAHPYHWLLFEPIHDHIERLPFLTDSNVILVNFNKKLAHFDLKQGIL